MATIATQANTDPKSKRRNWWKIGFFVMLFAFEVAREIAVLSGSQVAEPSAVKTVFRMDGYVVATGVWLRTDGGSPLVPGTVKIECRQDTNQCIEVWTNSDEKTFYAPNVDWHRATFTPTTVGWTNDNPTCAHYSVTIDTQAERVIATRDRKEQPTHHLCKGMEERIAMELGNGWDRDYGTNMDDHFVPLL